MYRVKVFHTMTDNFFRYQHDVLGTLLRWGVGSAVGGPLAMVVPSPFWRQFGLQAFTWGAIDTLLAIAGRRGARVKAVRYEEGELDDAAVEQEAEKFRTILLVNAGLDLAYITSGLWTAAAFPDRPDRRGLGLGIALQGFFLLAYDAALAYDVKRRWLAETEAEQE